MTNPRVFVILLFVLIIIFIGFVLLQSLSTQITSNISPQTIENKIQLESQVEGYNLALNNKEVFSQILSTQQTFETGVTDPVSKTAVKPKSLKIILTPTEQPKLGTFWQGDKGKINGISGDYLYDSNNGLVTILIYIAPGVHRLEDPNFRDNAFNYQLLNMLVSANPNKNLSQGSSVFDVSRELQKKYFQDDVSKYPIRINK